jgi:hypothetical protein
VARGIILGNIIDSTGSPVNAGSAQIVMVQGGDVNGRNVNFNPVKIKDKYRKVLNELLRDGGVFVLPFNWNPASDDLARVAANELLDIKVIVFSEGSTDYRTFWGKAGKVPDVVQMLNNIKNGRLIASGDTGDLWKKLKPEMKNAVTSKEFDSPLTMLSTEQTAIIGVMPDCRYA